MLTFILTSLPVVSCAKMEEKAQRVGFVNETVISSTAVLLPMVASGARAGRPEWPYKLVVVQGFSGWAVWWWWWLLGVFLLL